MTLLSLIAFVYLLFAYQNYLNKRTQAPNKNETEASSDQQTEESIVGTKAKEKSLGSTAPLEPVIESKSLKTITIAKEPILLNDLSSSNELISALDNESMTSQNLDDSNSFNKKADNITWVNENLQPIVEDEESVENPPIENSLEDTVDELNFEETVNRKEQEIDFNQESAKDGSKKESDD